MLNALYKSNQNINPNDSLVYILNVLHNELKKSKNINKKKSDIFNKQSVLSNGFTNFQYTNTSLISNILNWFELKEFTCTNCNQTMYTFHTYNTLELDILGCYKMSNPNSFLTIENCLQYQMFPKQTKLYCFKCKKYNIIKFTSKIFSSPNNFIFLLDRGNMQPNLMNIRFMIEEYIDLGKYVDTQAVPTKYQLNGILSIDSNQQKYVCFCLSPSEKKYYLYDDDKISILEPRELINAHNNNQYIPCILSYHSINTK